MRFLLLSLVISFFSLNVSAQDAKAQGILDRLSTKMKGMKSFYKTPLLAPMKMKLEKAG
jgi:elongation factor P hydroxylase